MPTQEKIDRVEALKDKLERCSIALSADYTGISVNEMTELRRQMRAAGVEFTIIKNTLMYLASDAAHRPNVKEIVQGPTAVALGYDDPLDVAKAVADYIRTSRSSLTIRGAVLGDGPAMQASEVNRLAALPPKPQLLAILLGQLQAPIQRLASILNGPLQSLDGLIMARISQLEESGAGDFAGDSSGAPPEEAEASAEPEESPEAAEATEPEASVVTGEAAETAESSEPVESEDTGETQDTGAAGEPEEDESTESSESRE